MVRRPPLNLPPYVRVVSALPVLVVDVDSDGDGIDGQTSSGDGDGNGIPDYLDNMPSSNILPQQGNQTATIECDPGVRCGLGLFALGGSSGGCRCWRPNWGALISRRWIRPSGR